MAPLVVRAADSFVIELSWPIAHWLVEVASKFEIHEDIFISLLARLLNLADTGDMSSADQVESSLIGQVTNSYFRWWYRKGPRDAQGLDSPFRDLFSRIADTTIEKFRHGRVFLAKNAVALFRVDEKWAREHLLGLFDWDTSPIEAVSAWKGFLSTPQLYWPFLSAVESAFLATANHYEELGSHGQQYVDLLTFAALDGFEFIAAGKLKSATRALPLEGLIHVADTLVRALEGSGNKTQAFWKERVVPYLRRVWPANARLWPYLDQITESNARQSIAESMARLSIVAGNAFPQALDLVKPWLMLLQSSDYPVHLLSISELAAKNPLEALRLLVAIVDVGAGWAPSELRTCLDVIAKAAPNLKNTTDFKSLDEFARRRNQ
jgi:hypothetical protein